MLAPALTSPRRPATCCLTLRPRWWRLLVVATRPRPEHALSTLLQGPWPTPLRMMVRVPLARRLGVLVSCSGRSERHVSCGGERERAHGAVPHAVGSRDVLRARGGGLRDQGAVAQFAPRKPCPRRPPRVLLCSQERFDAVLPAIVGQLCGALGPPCLRARGLLTGLGRYVRGSGKMSAGAAVVPGGEAGYALFGTAWPRPRAGAALVRARHDACAVATYVAPCIAALAAASVATADTLWKPLNTKARGRPARAAGSSSRRTQVLLASRSRRVAQRLAALSCVSALFARCAGAPPPPLCAATLSRVRSCGEEWVAAQLPETLPFFAELMEDEVRARAAGGGHSDEHSPNGDPPLRRMRAWRRRRARSCGRRRRSRASRSRAT